MNSPLRSLVLPLTLLACSSTHCLAGDVSVTIPRTAQAANSAEALSRAQQLILRFLTACFSDDQAGLARTVTDDAVVEYALAEPGVYLTVDATALNGYCGAHVPKRYVEQISNLWIFPTNDSNTVFAQYNIDSQSDSFSTAVSKNRLALVELRDDRIVKIRDFTTSIDDIEAGVGSAPSTCR